MINGGDGSDTFSAVGMNAAAIEGTSATSVGAVINMSAGSIAGTLVSTNMANAIEVAAGRTVGISASSGSVATNTTAYTYAANTTTGSTAADTLISIENVVGSTGNDFIIGSAAANTITGGAGYDFMTGGLGSDTFGLAGVAQSVARSAEGLNATIVNNDTITFGNGVDVISDFVSGTDTIDFTVAGATTAPTSLVTGAAQAALVVGTSYFLLGTWVQATGVFTVNTAATAATANVAIALLQATTVDTAESANHTGWVILTGIASIAATDIV